MGKRKKYDIGGGTFVYFKKSLLGLIPFHWETNQILFPWGRYYGDFLNAMAIAKYIK